MTYKLTEKERNKIGAEVAKWAIDDLKKALNEEELSLELIQRCRDDFHMIGGRYYIPTINRFRKLFVEKVKKSNVDLSEDRANQLVTLMSRGGVLKFKDIVFVDNTAFDIFYPDDVMINGGFTIDYITYHYTSDRYIWRSFLDLTSFFCLEKFRDIDEATLSKLREEINQIFIKYFNNDGCPERLGLAGCRVRHVDSFAISNNKDEIVNGLINRTPFNVSIIGRDGNGETKLTKLDITCDLSKDPILTVTDVDDKMEFLTDIFNSKKKDNSSEENSIGSMTFRNNSSKKTSSN